MPKRREQVPLVERPSDAAPQSRGPRHDVRVHPRATRDRCSRCASARRWPTSAMPPCGPPCRSMAMSNRSRRSRRASAMSSRTRARPRRFGDDDDVVEVGIAANDRRGRRFDDVGEVGVRDTCAAARATRGVVNTTSPISRSRTRRIFGSALATAGWCGSEETTGLPVTH